MGYIFDLDQTIVDSSIAEETRNRKDWITTYSLIPRFNVYEGMYEVFELIHSKNEKICIVTSSPSSYCKKVVNYFNFPIDAMVCYHDTVKHKPNPEPILKALSILGEPAENVISIGDASNDVLASNSAGVVSCLALWGKGNPISNVYADYVFRTVTELREMIAER